MTYNDKESYIWTGVTMTGRRNSRNRRQEILRRKKLGACTGALAVLFVCLVIAISSTLNAEQAEAGENGKNQTNENLPVSGTVTPEEPAEKETPAEPVEQVGQGLTIVLDPGHGAKDPGCGIEAENVWEADLTLAIARKIEPLLTAAGYTVIYTRQEEEEYINIWDRAAFANEKKADLFVSIHLNSDGTEEGAVGDGIAEGIETWYYGKKDKVSVKLAEAVQEAVIASTQAKNLKTKEDTYIVIKDSAMPACLVECGFLTHKEERSRLITDEYQQKLAEGIVTGIKEFTKEYLTKDAGSDAASAQ